MNKRLFERLVQSMNQHNEIRRTNAGAHPKRGVKLRAKKLLVRDASRNIGNESPKTVHVKAGRVGAKYSAAHRDAHMGSTLSQKIARLPAKRRAKIKARAAQLIASQDLTVTRWDPVDRLRNAEEIAAYLAAAIKEAGDDAAYIAAVLGDIAKARGIMALAKSIGMTRAGLDKVLSEGGNPSFATILKIIRALGLKLVPEVA